MAIYAPSLGMDAGAGAVEPVSLPSVLSPFFCF
jgi:hypothetical protein